MLLSNVVSIFFSITNTFFVPVFSFCDSLYFEYHEIRHKLYYIETIIVIISSKWNLFLP
jgi:hypothetical protein